MNKTLREELEAIFAGTHVSAELGFLGPVADHVDKLAKAVDEINKQLSSLGRMTNHYACITNEQLDRHEKCLEAHEKCLEATETVLLNLTRTHCKVHGDAHTKQEEDT